MKMGQRVSNFKCGLGLVTIRGPYSVTGTCTLQMNVSTKNGKFHQLNIEMNIHDAAHLKDISQDICQKFVKQAHTAIAMLER